MKANEFIRDHGVAEAERVLRDARGCVGVKLWGRYEFSTDELRSLVESHDLVESYGGIPTVKTYIKITANKNTKLFLSLKQAILDVESCQ